MDGLTLSERNFLKSLKTFIEAKGYTPTLQELGDYVGFSSKATVHYYINQLEKKGYISRLNNRKIIIEKEVE